MQYSTITIALQLTNSPIWSIVPVVKPSLTTIGRELSALSDEVLARVKALRPTATYRVLRRCPVRDRPSQKGTILEYLETTLPDGSPHLVVGCLPVADWVEMGRGYVAAWNLRRVER